MAEPHERGRTPDSRPREAHDVDALAPSGPPDERIYLLTRDAVREVDRRAVEEYHIPSIVLMENAALHLAEVACQLTGEIPDPRVLILVGPGNNGGDGLALARHLDNSGVDVTIAMLESAGTSGDPETHRHIATAIGLSGVTLAAGHEADSFCDLLAQGQPYDLIVDALFGTGLDRPIEPPLSHLIEAINQAREDMGIHVLAADIPTGLDADEGVPLGVSIRADTTVTFVGLKPGFASLEAQEYLGDIVVAGIGAPRALVEELGELCEPADHFDRDEQASTDDLPHPARAEAEAPRRA